MKRLLFLLPLLPVVAYAQHGTVRYEHVQSLDYELPDEFKEVAGMEEMMAQFPTANKSFFILEFNGSASLMREDEEREDSLETSFDMDMERFIDAAGGEEQAMAMGMAVINTFATVDLDSAMQATNIWDEFPSTQTFIDFDAYTVTEERDIMERKFRVTSDFEPLSWRITGEERTFMGYRILQATTMQDTLAIEAWYTPEILVPAGPKLYGGLPGLVLILHVGADKETYTATHIDLETEPEVAPPTEGKAMTREEFESTAEAWMKDMQTQVLQMQRNLPELFGQ